jgi:hypothetical protein
MVQEAGSKIAWTLKNDLVVPTAELVQLAQAKATDARRKAMQVVETVLDKCDHAEVDVMRSVVGTIRLIARTLPERGPVAAYKPQTYVRAPSGTKRLETHPEDLGEPLMDDGDGEGIITIDQLADALLSSKTRGNDERGAVLLKTLHALMPEHLQSLVSASYPRFFAHCDKASTNIPEGLRALEGAAVADAYDTLYSDQTRLHADLAMLAICSGQWIRVTTAAGVFAASPTVNKTLVVMGNDVSSAQVEWLGGRRLRIVSDTRKRKRDAGITTEEKEAMWLAAREQLKEQHRVRDEQRREVGEREGMQGEDETSARLRIDDERKRAAAERRRMV